MGIENGFSRLLFQKKDPLQRPKYDSARFMFFNTFMHMLENAQACFEHLAVFTPQDFVSMLDHFSTLYMRKS